MKLSKWDYVVYFAYWWSCIGKGLRLQPLQQACSLTDPVYPGLFYKHLCHWFILWLSVSSLSSKSSKYHISQTERDRELKFWENVHPPQHVTCHVLPVTCHVSYVICHVSHVMCNMSHVICHMSHYFILLFLLLFGQSGEAYWWRVCYRWGLPRLVSIQGCFFGWRAKTLVRRPKPPVGTRSWP